MLCASLVAFAHFSQYGFADIEWLHELQSGNSAFANTDEDGYEHRYCHDSKCELW